MGFALRLCERASGKDEASEDHAASHAIGSFAPKVAMWASETSLLLQHLSCRRHSSLNLLYLPWAVSYVSFPPWMRAGKSLPGCKTSASELDDPEDELLDDVLDSAAASPCPSGAAAGGVAGGPGGGGTSITLPTFRISSELTSPSCCGSTGGGGRARSTGGAGKASSGGGTGSEGALSISR